MLDYDGSLHDLVELVTSFETSPRSSKSESGCSSYGHSRFVVPASFQGGGISAPGLFEISGPRKMAKDLAAGLTVLPPEIWLEISCLARISGGGGEGGISGPRFGRIFRPGIPQRLDFLGGYKYPPSSSLGWCFSHSLSLLHC